MRRSCRFTSLSLRVVATLVLASLAVASSLAQAPTEDRKYTKESYFDFRGKPLPEEFTLTPEGTDKYLKSEPEGLRITLPKDRKNLAPVEIASRIGVQGDFEITVALEILKAEKPRDGFGVGASIFVNKVDPAVEGATLGRLLRPSGKEVVFWDQGFGKTKESLQFDIEYATCTEKLLRLRLKRTGDELSYSWGAGLTGEKFVELAPKIFGLNDLQQVIVRVTTGRQPCDVEVRLIDLRIRSGPASAKGVPAAIPSDRSNLWLLALLVMLAIVGVLALGFGLRRRDRAASQPIEVAHSAVTFTCPKCQKTLKTNPSMAGKKVKCAGCGTAMLIPSAIQIGEAPDASS